MSFQTFGTPSLLTLSAVWICCLVTSGATNCQHQNPETGNCFVLSDSKKSYDDANQHCWGLGGYLPKAKSYSDVVSLYNLAPGELWVSLVLPASSTGQCHSSWNVSRENLSLAITDIDRNGSMDYRHKLVSMLYCIGKDLMAPKNLSQLKRLAEFAIL